MTITLSNRQQKVLINSLAWLSDRFDPTEGDIEDFFGYIEKGIKLTSKSNPGAAELYHGWCAHYGDEFSWIKPYEKRGGNAPVAPPASWIYESGGWGKNGFWIGWLTILVDCLRDWPRSKPMFERAYNIHCYLKGLLTSRQLHECLLEQKR